MPRVFTDEEAAAAPRVFTEEEAAEPRVFTDDEAEDAPRVFTDEEAGEAPRVFTDEEADADGSSLAGRIAGEVKEQAVEIARQGAAGVARDLPRMAWNTAAALLPGETPSAENPQGTGAAGFAGQVVEEIASAEEKAAWDDPAKKGWAGVPGMAARSLAPNLLVGVATGGAGVAAMPFL
jgi:hypothetical protein